MLLNGYILLYVLLFTYASIRKYQDFCKSKQLNKLKATSLDIEEDIKNQENILKSKISSILPNLEEHNVRMKEINEDNDNRDAIFEKASNSINTGLTKTPPSQSNMPIIELAALVNRIEPRSEKQKEILGEIFKVTTEMFKEWNIEAWEVVSRKDAFVHTKYINNKDLLIAENLKLLKQYNLSETRHESRS